MLSVEFYEFCCSYAVNGIKTDINFDVGKFFGKFDNRNLKLMCWFLFISKNGDTRYYTSSIIFITKNISRLTAALSRTTISSGLGISLFSNSSYNVQRGGSDHLPTTTRSISLQNITFDLASHITQFAGSYTLKQQHHSMFTLPCRKIKSSFETSKYINFCVRPQILNNMPNTTYNFYSILMLYCSRNHPLKEVFNFFMQATIYKGTHQQ